MKRLQRYDHFVYVYVSLLKIVFLLITRTPTRYSYIYKSSKIVLFMDATIFQVYAIAVDYGMELLIQSLKLGIIKQGGLHVLHEQE